jgi:hypothetical protein
VQGADGPVDHDPAAIGVRRAALVVAAFALATVASPSAQGRWDIVVLPSPFSPLRPAPPLPASAAAAETRFPGRLFSRQAVRVSVDTSGTPFRVVDVDRILIGKTGDYSFAVAGPIENVRPAQGSGTKPGLRTGAVVWQGFSPARRVLAAAISLRPRAAASALPLRVEVGQSGVLLANATSASATAVDAPVSAVDVARVLDAARKGLATGTPVPAPLVNAVGPIRKPRVVAYAPLRVRGSIRLGSAPIRRIAAVVGSKPLRIRGRGELKALDLSISVPEPATVLRPPASSWIGAARSGRLRGGRAITRRAVARLLEAALAVQFHELLANPDGSGTSRTSYRYVLARRPHPVAATHTSSGGGWVAPLAIGLGIAAAAVGGLVIWAHS